MRILSLLCCLLTANAFLPQKVSRGSHQRLGYDGHRAFLPPLLYAANISISAPESSFIEDSFKNRLENQQEVVSFPEKYGSTAIVLNTNARSVRPDFGAIAEEVFGAENVFLTTSEEEAKEAAQRIAASKYSLIIGAGGDGTLSSLIDMIAHERAKRESTSLEQAVATLPKIGYIPMGTGNGMGSVIGCRLKTRGLWPGAKRRRKKELKRVLQELEAIGAGETDDYDVVEMPIMQVDYQNQHDLCFFAGAGFDSLMLNDFKHIKAWSKRTGIMKRVLGSVAGYSVALIARTLPQALRGKHNVHVTVTANNDDTLWVDHRRGDFVRPVKDKRIYEGTTGILAGATSPYYGGGLRLFPFARMTTDKMHLRIGRIHPLTGFINIPGIFKGSYRDESNRFGCLDFLGSDFEVQISSDDQKGFPFQHSGESVGMVDKFRLKVIKEPVRFVSLGKVEPGRE